MTGAAYGVSLSEAAEDFDRMAEIAFRHQVESSRVYSRFAGNHVWTDWRSAPYLPVEAFKWPGVVGSEDYEVIFESSGTGGTPSCHPIVDLSLYEDSITRHFEAQFGDGPFTFLAHLPTYHKEGKQSSLLHMVAVLMQRYGSEASSSFVDPAQLDEFVKVAVKTDAPIILFGTAFGLADMVDGGAKRLPIGARVIETGGMKTRRREISRRELHARLAEGFGVDRSHVVSEYGMCELLSQCYTTGDEVFHAPPWVRFQIRDVEDPDRTVDRGEPGLLAIFDLANFHSVSAILTSDMAVSRDEGFELLGRADAAEIRGCNFLMSSDP